MPPRTNHPLKRCRAICVAVLSALVIIGCASSRPVQKSGVQFVSGQEAVVASGMRNIQDEYRLGFGDVIEVKFFNNDRFNEIVTVRPDGRISLERIGDIQVSGMTPSQLDSIVTTTYRQFLINPDVTVFVREFGGYNVYVLGQVDAPGGYPIQRNMTVLQALAVAGGPISGAQLKSVMLLRPDKNGDVTALKINADQGLAGLTDKEFYVRPQDIVYVPRTFIASVSNFLDQIYDGLLPPVEAYLRAVYWSRRK